jgi:hypothetical protein
MDEDEARRLRSLEMIALADRAVSEPRDLEAKHRAQQWIDEAHRRQEQECPPPPKPPKAATYTRQHFDAALAEARKHDRKALEALAEAMGEIMGKAEKEFRKRLEALEDKTRVAMARQLMRSLELETALTGREVSPIPTVLLPKHNGGQAKMPSDPKASPEQGTNAPRPGLYQ